MSLKKREGLSPYLEGVRNEMIYFFDKTLSELHLSKAHLKLHLASAFHASLRRSSV